MHWSNHNGDIYQSRVIGHVKNHAADNNLGDGKWLENLSKLFWGLLLMAAICLRHHYYLFASCMVASPSSFAYLLPLFPVAL